MGNFFKLFGYGKSSQDQEIPIKPMKEDIRIKQSSNNSYDYTHSKNNISHVIRKQYPLNIIQRPNRYGGQRMNQRQLNDQYQGYTNSRLNSGVIIKSETTNKIQVPRQRTESINRNYPINRYNQQTVRRTNVSVSKPNINRRQSADKYRSFQNNPQKNGLQMFVITDLWSYCLPQYIKLQLRFQNVFIYQQYLQSLLKHQLIEKIKDGIDSLEQQGLQQSKIKVKIEIFTPSRHEKNHKKGFCLRPIDPENQHKQNAQKLQQALLMGPTIGFLYFSEAQFKKQYLQQQGMAIICYLQKFKRNILLKGIDQYIIQKIPKTQIYFVNLQSITTYNRQIEAIKNIHESIFKRNLIGYQQKKVQSIKRKELLQSKVYKQIYEKRNQSQRDAIKEICTCDQGIFLIQGPPGTGKTQTITNLVSIQHYYIKKQVHKANKILICSESNAAIDNIAIKLQENGLIGHSHKPKLLRLGQLNQNKQDLLLISLNHLAQLQLIKKINGHVGANFKSISILKLQQADLKQKMYKLKKSHENQQQKNKIRKQLNNVNGKLKLAQEFKSDHYNQYKAIQRGILQDGEIIMCTLSTSGKQLHLQIFKNYVSCVIIDEAGQATQPSTLIPFQINPNKVILVGDHKQLNPTVFSNNVSQTSYNRSLFEKFIQNKYQFHQLNIQYRMIPQLSKYFNEAFYFGKLKDGKITKPHPAIYQKIQKYCILYDIAYGKQQERKKSKINYAESQAIIYLIGRLVGLDKHLTIGVITPYKSQIKVLDDGLQKLNLPERIMENIKVSTVDSFQGQQRDIIIISNVRANKNKNIGFLKDEKRMNVTLSRCKFALFVFGHQQTFIQNKQSDIWQNYINYHEQNSTIKVIKSKAKMRQIINQNFIKLPNQSQ